MSARVVKFASYIDRQFLERSINSMDNESSELFQAMMRPDTRAMIGEELFRLELIRMRITEICDAFKEPGDAN